MQSKATTVAQYLKELPDDRRKAIAKLRSVIKKNLPKGFEEGMQYGMIGYYVPHKLYPNGYHCDPKQPLPFASIASQKNHMALYTMTVYSNPDIQAWFTKAWTAAGHKLDMGKSCIRFKKIEDVPLDVVGQLFTKVSVEQYIELYENAYLNRSKPAPKTSGKKKTTKKAAKKTTAKKPSKKKVSKKTSRKKA
ncbi:MAG: DUF1801 domain-containing protein [Phycisphaerales bacterium JB063]